MWDLDGIHARIDRYREDLRDLETWPANYGKPEKVATYKQTLRRKIRDLQARQASLRKQLEGFPPPKWHFAKRLEQFLAKGSTSWD